MPYILPVVLSREQHIVSRKNISKNALKVLYRLNKAGYEAYLVGGGVRDLLLDKVPKDFDVTTNATPEQVRKLFRNCRLIGRRFRLAHIIFKSEIIEVATFRGHHKNNFSNHAISQYDKKGMLLRDNIFGSIEEDAQRRDFTINSLYYNVFGFTIHDYVGGIKDLKRGVIKLIGDPETRYCEDPVRMLRAIRFAVKLNMKFSPETIGPIPRLATLLSEVSPARLFEEALKLLQDGNSYGNYKLLRKYNLFQPLFPIIVRYSTKTNINITMEKMISQVFRMIDNYIHNNIKLDQAFLFSAIFWYPLLETAKEIVGQTHHELFSHDIFVSAADNVLNEVCSTLAIPKRITSLVRDIWQLQIRITTLYQQKKHARKLLEHPKFFVAYNLLTLRSRIEKKQELQKIVNWWNGFQISGLQKKKSLTNNFSNKVIL